jgi:rhodanese-related sulfurtransferase
MSESLEPIQPGDAARRLEAGDGLVLLDVREAGELALARVKGAVHIPMHEVPDRASELDVAAEIAVLCHHGIRSQMVTNWLREHGGFTRVRNVAGGIDAWAREVDERVGRY